MATGAAYVEEDGRQITCSQCGTRKWGYYWIHDVLWLEAEQKAGKKLGNTCPICIERILGRFVTLHDLDIRHYLRSNKHMIRFALQETVRATIVGACQEVAIVVPEGWVEPIAQLITEMQELGRHLARHTTDPMAVVAKLISEANEEFPVDVAQHELQGLRYRGELSGTAAGLGIPLGQLTAIADGIERIDGPNTKLARGFVEGIVACDTYIGWISVMHSGPPADVFRDGIKAGILAAAQKRGLTPSRGTTL